MKTHRLFVLISFLILILLTACGPSQEELNTTATQEMANDFATQTALAPTATPTYTPSPAPTHTPVPTSTFTPTPTDTPTPSPSPSPTPATIGAANAAQVALLDTLTGLEGVNNVVFSPTGLVAVSFSEQQHLISGYIHYGEMLTTPLAPQAALPDSGPGMWVFPETIFSSDGKVLANFQLDSNGYFVSAWEMAEDFSLQPVTRLASGYGITSFDLSADGQYVASFSNPQEHYEKIWHGNCPFNCYLEIKRWTDPGQGFIYQLPEGTLVSQLDASQVKPYHYAGLISPDNSYLATIYSDGTFSYIQLWNVSDGSLIQTLDALPYRKDITALAFMPDGISLAVTGGGKLQLWQWEQDTFPWSVEGKFSAVAVAPNGELIVTGAPDGTLQLWQASDGMLLATLTGHSSPVTDVGFSPNGLMLVSLDETGELRLWSLPE